MCAALTGLAELVTADSYLLRQRLRPDAAVDDERYVRRVLRAFDARRIGVVTLVALLLSAEVLSSSQLLAFFSPAEIALAWLEHAAELAVLAAALTVTYTLLEQALWRQPRRRRLVTCCALLFVL